MPYKKTSDLPSSVRDHLPPKAQEIYMKAFNNAYEEYDNEETAFKVAWSAVKKKYKKDSSGGSTWKRK